MPFSDRALIGSRLTHVVEHHHRRGRDGRRGWRFGGEPPAARGRLVEHLPSAAEEGDLNQHPRGGLVEAQDERCVGERRKRVSDGLAMDQLQQGLKEIGA